MRTIKTLLAAIALMLSISPAGKAAVVYDVVFETSNWAGSVGYFDLQFLPLDAGAPATQATLSLFTSDGVLNAGAVADGAVSGVLPGMLVFQNTNAFNAWLQPFSFGSALSFQLAFSGDWEVALDGSVSTLSVTLLNETLDALAPSSTFDLYPGGNIVSNAGASTVTAVPLPAAWILLLSGLPLLRRMSRKHEQGNSG